MVYCNSCASLAKEIDRLTAELADARNDAVRSEERATQLAAENARLRSLRVHELTCARCACLLLPPQCDHHTLPHCEDCNPDDEQAEAWLARYSELTAALKGSKP